MQLASPPESTGNPADTAHSRVGGVPLDRTRTPPAGARGTAGVPTLPSTGGTPPVSASLEANGVSALETSEQLYSDQWPTTTHYQRQVFGLDLPERNRLIAALRILDTDHTRKLAAKLDDCCRCPQIAATLATGALHVIKYRCRSRLCPSCGKLRARAVQNAITPYVLQMDSPRFITLTLKSSTAPLKAQISRLLTSFKRLRASRFWRKAQSGGLYTLEITYNRRLGLWHPHLHIIADGRFMPQPLLAHAWEIITGDSKIVDIRMVHSRRALIGYVCTYVSKTQDSRKIPDFALEEWAGALKSVRTHGRFGTLHRMKVAPLDGYKMPDAEPIVSLNKLIDAAEHGDAIAAALLHEAWDLIECPHPTRGHAWIKATKAWLEPPILPMTPRTTFEAWLPGLI